MAGAIEVLKKEKKLYLNKIEDIKEGNKARAEDIVKMYEKTIKVYEEFVNAIDEALLALEKKEDDFKIGWQEGYAESLKLGEFGKIERARKQSALEIKQIIKADIERMKNIGLKGKQFKDSVIAIKIVTLTNLLKEIKKKGV